MITQLHGDCRDILQTIESESVQAVVTSPPYFGLRDYGVAGQIGLEAIPDCLAWARQEPPCAACYVCTMRTVFAGVWRVLKADGVCWLNLGDSYANDTKWGGATGGKHAAGVHGNTGIGRTKTATGMPSKSLMMIPARVALALQSDGWIVRSDIVWAKGNPMPESVKDRPTRSHETIYLLAKQERYYYDQDAVREPLAPNTLSKNGIDESGKGYPVNNRGATPEVYGVKEFSGNMKPGAQRSMNLAGRNLRDVWQINPKPFSGAHFAVFPEAIPERCIRASTKPGDTVLDPFAGSGTTLRVAERLQRHAIGIELNEDYLDLQDERTNGVQIELLF